MRLIANVSMLFKEFALPERLDAARECGFEAVEIQFPGQEEIGLLQEAMQRSGMSVALINVPRGPGDAVGLAALPGEQVLFRAAVDECVANVQALGPKKVNVLSGRPPHGEPAHNCLQMLKENLCFTADRMAKFGVRVMVEPVNTMDVPGFFLSNLDSALTLLDDLAHPNLALQFDLYHMAITEPDLEAAIDRAGTYIGHVQFADSDGRHEPGSGKIDFPAAIAALKHAGYDGDISAEYHPKSKTKDGLGWMEEFKRMLA